MTTTTAPTAPPLLTLALRLDAVVTGLNGAAYLALAPFLGELLGLAPGPLRGVGAFLVLFAVGVWAVGSRGRVPVAGVEAVICLNVLWVAASVAVAVADLGSPSVVGVVWIHLQAAVVAAFAALQIAGLRRRS
ncbi:hypothetical protein [Blastococcus deserti]|uniref:Uncharacterized protein n=1 Tax=Blastococcus deserti TaxID=2259033 RepID=A0ABW4X6Y1_9ACTN